MLPLITGFVLGVGLAYAFNASWIAALTLLAVGVGVQVGYAHRLNAFLGGVDPVRAFRANSLSELRVHLRVPLSVRVLHFAAKCCFWAAVVLCVSALGWLRLD